MPEDHVMILPQTGMITFLPNIAVASNSCVGTNIPTYVMYLQY